VAFQENGKSVKMVKKEKKLRGKDPKEKNPDIWRIQMQFGKHEF